MCPLCEAPVARGDSFCEACGHPLASPSCVSCGAAAVDAEGYCERCGVRQPTARDHAESVLPHGAAAVTDRGLRRARNEDAVTLLTLTAPPPNPIPPEAATIPVTTSAPRTPPPGPPRTGGTIPPETLPPRAAGAVPLGTPPGATPADPAGTFPPPGATSAGRPVPSGTATSGAAGTVPSGTFPPSVTPAGGAVPLGAVGSGTIAVVCDGVGSSPRADEAAAAAVAAAAAALAEGRPHEEAFALAGLAVGKLASSPDHAPACTYVAAVARPGEITLCWAGDTRAYWLADVPADGGVRREGTLLTEDDVAPTGEITAWLGADYPDVRPRTRVFTPPGPGLLLVCSDGLWRYLAGYRFPTEGTPLDQARQMLRHALDSGGHDNVTIALIPLGGTHG
ncbi:protein phosphatase 2C domain-containing protein [Nonomuraea sp. NPDC050478]|uniref:PP2C family serine/threonine-protein phosphatase n=1 Tax=Nonomuraea sp. NPDC050478 TaxID=3364365 RepID=UPI00379D7195